MEESNIELSHLQPPTKKQKNESERGQGDNVDEAAAQHLAIQGDIDDKQLEKVLPLDGNGNNKTDTVYQEIDIYSSSDEDENEDWTNEDFLEYMRTISINEGYYIPDKPEGVKVSSWGPGPVKNLNKLATIADAALCWYNDKGPDKQKYKLQTAKHGTSSCSAGLLYRVVFVALSDDGETQEFRAKVLHDAEIDDLVVKSVEKHTSDGSWLAPPTSSNASDTVCRS